MPAGGSLNYRLSRISGYEHVLNADYEYPPDIERGKRIGNQN